MCTDLLILAGGASSRMKASAATSGLSEDQVAEANTRSKGLITLSDGKPLLHYLIMNAKKAGFTRVTLIVSPTNKHQFQEVFGSEEAHNTYEGLTISYARQYVPDDREKPLGTADAVYQALEQYPGLKRDSFAVCNSDNLYSVKAMELIRNTTAENAFIAYDRDGLQFPSEKIARFALTRLDAKNRLMEIVEKPNVDDLPRFKDASGTLRVSMNIFRFSGPAILEYLKDCPLHPERNEKELATAILAMCKNPEHYMEGIPLKEHVPDLTSKGDIETLKKHL